VTAVRCPFGHSFLTNEPPGSQVKCAQCRREYGDITTFVVPGGPEPVPLAPEKPFHPEGTEWATCARCTCSNRCLPGQDMPIGWLSITMGTDPATDHLHRSRKVLGPFCGLPCAVTAMRGEVRGTDFRQLMAQPPTGADRAPRGGQQLPVSV
jgi:hypothetical protein